MARDFEGFFKKDMTGCFFRVQASDNESSNREVVLYLAMVRSRTTKVRIRHVPWPRCAWAPT
eukprot:11168833-Lingulodinium_polyedra.AAC.1